MSDAHNENESVIKTPKQLVAAVAAGFLVPIICIVLLVQYVAHGPVGVSPDDQRGSEAIAERLKPVADAGFTLVDANAPKQLLAGDAVYKATCAACHDTGAAGAPKLGDTGAWAPRLAQGQATVVKHALEGLRAMPAKGGNADLDNIEVERAVVFMANKSGGKFKEPEAPAPAAATATEPAPSAGAPVASASEPLASPSQQTEAVTGGETAKIDGKKIFDSSCTACHTPGVAGAPKLGDKAAWEARIAQGKDTLYEHAIKGFQGKSGVMPAKGGSSATDEEVKAAVDYMAAAVK